jgi:hypothetical protein
LLEDAALLKALVLDGVHGLLLGRVGIHDQVLARHLRPHLLVVIALQLQQPLVSGPEVPHEDLDVVLLDPVPAGLVLQRLQLRADLLCRHPEALDHQLDLLLLALGVCAPQSLLLFGRYVLDLPVEALDMAADPFPLVIEVVAPSLPSILRGRTIVTVPCRSCECAIVVLLLTVGLVLARLVRLQLMLFLPATAVARLGV